MPTTDVASAKMTLLEKIQTMKRTNNDLRAQLTINNEKTVLFISLANDIVDAGLRLTRRDMLALFKRANAAKREYRAEMNSETRWVYHYFGKWQAARQSRARLVEFVRYRARELENADEFIRDIEAECDAAIAECQRRKGIEQDAQHYRERAEDAEAQLAQVRAELKLANGGD